MDFLDNFTTRLGSVLGVSLVNILIAIVVFVVGWLVAMLISRLVKTLLHKTTLDDRVTRWVGGDEARRDDEIAVESWISTAVFWLLMLVVLIAVFQILEFGAVTNTLNGILTQILDFVPNILAAGLLVLLAWIVASALKWIVVRALRATNLDSRVNRELPETDKPRASIAETIGTAVYWIVFLFFLPAILGALDLGGLLAPVQSMISELLAFLPNLFAAAIILVIGWFAARIIRRVVSSVLAAVGVDQLGNRVGLSSDTRRLSDVLGLVVYILVLVPVIVAALNALSIAAVTEPATNMLNSFLLAIPNIFAAALVLFVSYVIARVVAGLVENLLSGIGFDDLMARLGWRARTDRAQSDRAQSDRVGMTAEADTAMPEREVEVKWGPSRVVSWLIVVVVMLFALVEAFNLLGFEQLALLMTALVGFIGQVVLGLVVFGIGLFLANMVGRAIKQSDSPNANLMGWLAEGAILVFAGAMALRQMGLANSIIDLAFGLLIGAIAVAAALAFGLGGREVAGRKLAQWVRSVESGDVDAPEPPTMEPTPGGRPTRSYRVPGAATGGVSASGTDDPVDNSPYGTQDLGRGPERPDSPREPMP